MIVRTQRGPTVREGVAAQPSLTVGPRIVCLLMCISILGCTPPGKPIPPVAGADDTFDKLYAVHCAGCHGADGKYGSGPALHDEQYLTLITSVIDPLAVVMNGRKGTAMPAFAKAKNGPLTPEQIKIVIDGMNEKWKPKESPTSKPIEGFSKSGDAARGKTIYARTCATCHGVDGGGSPNAGAINNPSALALTSDEYLWQIGLIGRKELGCISPNVSGLQMTSAEASDLTAYLATWRKQP